MLPASVLGLALGVAMVRECRTPAVLPTVLTASLLATISASLSSSYALVISSYDPVIGFVNFVQALGLPVAAGALLGAVWRLVLRLRKRRMSDW